jgi:hypothetical protein
MTEKEVEITVLRNNPAKGRTKGEEIIIKEERGMRIWRISVEWRAGA